MSKKFLFFTFDRGKPVEVVPRERFDRARPKGSQVSASNRRRAAEKRIQREIEESDGKRKGLSRL